MALPRKVIDECQCIVNSQKCGGKIVECYNPKYRFGIGGVLTMGPTVHPGYQCIKCGNRLNSDYPFQMENP